MTVFSNKLGQKIILVLPLTAMPLQILLTTVLFLCYKQYSVEKMPTHYTNFFSV